MSARFVFLGFLDDCVQHNHSSLWRDEKEDPALAKTR
jgi:hypothetical protein